MKIEEIAVSQIAVDGQNSRKIDKKSDVWKSFKESISHGIEIPLIVLKTDDGYKLIAGHRRLAAAKELKLETVPCDVRTMLTDTDMAEIRVIENLQREDLTPIEEGIQIKTLLDSSDEDHTVETIAEKLGKSRAWVIRRARLAELHPSIIKDIKAGEMNWPIECLVLLACQPQELHQEIVNGFNHHQVDEAGLQRHLDNRACDLSKATFNPEEQGCVACPLRTGATPDLFNEVKGLGQCLNEKCFASKAVSDMAIKVQAARAKNAAVKLVSGEYQNPLKEHYKDVTPAYKYTQAKQTDKKAEQVFNVSTGKMQWVKFAVEPEYTSNRQKRKLDAAGKVIPLSMKEKQEGLRKRRVFAVLEKLMGLLKDSDRLPAVESGTLLNLVAHYGATVGRYFGEFGDGEAIKKAKKVVQAACGTSDILDVMDTVWARLKNPIGDSLKSHAASNIKDEHEANGKIVAGLLGLEWDTLFAQAVIDLPEPKSWSAKADAAVKSKPVKTVKRK